MKKIVKTIIILFILWIIILFICISRKNIWEAGIAGAITPLLGALIFSLPSYLCWESMHNIKNKNINAFRNVYERNNRINGYKKDNGNETIGNITIKYKFPRIVAGILLSFVCVELLCVFFIESSTIITNKFKTTTGIVQDVEYHIHTLKGRQYVTCKVNGIEFDKPFDWHNGDDVEITYLPVSKEIIKYCKKSET
ncbi:hypothetical protein [Clostridium saccharobutylicum]|uniref:DUF3592 domain-containing protein n=1 Tax=Clostridium saccharobutylicum DSM 13864 TaxID=1345695 RepID=U5MUY0_CLOSA|nr:hypothetical protein [Clostridium saccharobutylicum]AGX44353.1 hypothetical protein CLSA_c33900 [Clostridium saccharobutylicum DSM 13864]AQR91646.1 hypothetical protein CLOSC_33720 [Clostridium saccharobutylicum]AQS01551.1 hypothetical protein CSACC_33800 [Clostridium saccharobutylicum]AQS11158.1 hypothetical protein CLOBY_33120 [Clostridium saccharobutylicum]AQS15534.1 hypothetical protein CLOSACC_33800 [Clostridium saccharobutylicum]